LTREVESEKKEGKREEEREFRGFCSWRLVFMEMPINRVGASEIVAIFVISAVEHLESS